MIQNCQICKKVTVNTSENSFRLSHVPSFFHRLKTGSLIKKWIDSLPSYRVLADPQNIICFPTAVFFLLSKIPELRWSCNCRNMAIKKLPHRDGSVTVDKKLQAEKEIGSIYLYPKKIRLTTFDRLVFLGLCKGSTWKKHGKMKSWDSCCQ